MIEYNVHNIGHSQLRMRQPILRMLVPPYQYDIVKMEGRCSMSEGENT